jgi:prepilin signal peptidase PulO-like enzyme (type II secretory pathway)
VSPVVVGIFGPVIGSFLNLVIYRVPLRRSIIWPSSSCPHRGAPVNVLDTFRCSPTRSCAGADRSAGFASRLVVSWSGR